MSDGRFREDLYYRLNEITVRVPPLRERVGDAVVLASFFLRRFAAEYGRPVRGFASGGARGDQGSSVARKCPRAREPDQTRGRDGGRRRCSRPPISVLPPPGEEPQSLGIRAARARAEREVLQLALAQAGSNLSKAAKLLGISRPTLYDLMQQHQIGLDA